MSGSQSIWSLPPRVGEVGATANPGSSSSIPSTSPSTSRAIGPMVSKLGDSGHTPSRGMRPQVVFSPAVPQHAEGILTEPPVSLP